MVFKKLISRPLLLTCFLLSGVLVVLYFRSDERAVPRFLADDTALSFLINTPGCQIPAWNPWDDSVRLLFKKAVMPYRCPGPPSFLRIMTNSVVTVEEALLQYYYEVDPQSISCAFQEIRRGGSIKEKSIDNHFTFSKPLKLKFNQPLGIEFLRSTCNFADDPRIFHEFLPLTPLKAKVEERCLNIQSKALIHKPINVIFLGIDSISSLNFIRHFPKSLQYMERFLSPITMNGYNKVGDNTFPNLVPLLTGHFHQHYFDESRKERFFDDVDFSWKSFADLGYRTLLAEDAPNIATFNYFRNGFKRPPTDYYYRPFALAVERSDLKKRSKGQCFGGKMEMEVIYDYLKSFVGTMGDSRPFFAFLFLARLTHDVFNFAGYADEPTYHLLKFLKENKALDNTMLVFFSDHGIRYGNIRKTRIGQYEERLPFMHLILPKWFLKEHETIHKNLLINSQRLTTPFDVHATILHLASLLSNKTESNLKPGRSLFREISENRTCLDAGISPHWCTCQVSKPISKSLLIVQKAGSVIIETINNWTRSYQNKCSLLTLNEIFDARITDGSWNNRTAQNKLSLQQHFDSTFLLVISALPSNAMFEATVRCTLSECKVVDDISRINEYGKQSSCISDVVIKKFCSCL